MKNSNGNIIASAKVPPIEWPDDLEAKSTLVTVSIPVEKRGMEFSIEIDPERKIEEAVRLNNYLNFME